MNKVLILIAVLAVSSCSHKPIKFEQKPSVVVEPVKEPIENAKFKFLPSSLATIDDAITVTKIEEKVNEAVNGECFKNEMLKPGLKLNETKDSPQIVYSKIKSAQIEAVISYYSQRFTSAVAYAEKGIFYFNRRMIGGWSICDFASTALHESTHLSPLNYSHAFKNYKGREMTVPYYMNQIMEKCCK